MERQYSKIYTPDRAFMFKLKALDPRLGCVYRHDIERFVITWERPAGPPDEVWLVESETKGFRQPDDRDIGALCEGDLHRTDIKDRIDKVTHYMRRYRELEARRVSSNLRDATKDGKIQLMRAFNRAFNTGKANSAFRRVTPKPRGEVFSINDRRAVI